MSRPEPFVFEGQTYYPEKGSPRHIVIGVCSDCAFDEHFDCDSIPCGPHHYITAIVHVTKRLTQTTTKGALEC